MDSIKSRLKYFLKHLEIGQNKFEAYVGIANGYIASKSVTIASDILEKISMKYPNLNLEWLITGKGEMLREPNTHTGKNIQQLMPNADGYKEKYLEVLEKYSILQERYMALKEKNV
ncbi:MAG: hypothetical protein LBK47_05140 [Prevotellaceae bacterium]|jgi:hypothetical protein|nr:hypothetical protein [Prevotellaceae bacterium]